MSALCKLSNLKLPRHRETFKILLFSFLVLNEVVLAHFKISRRDSCFNEPEFRKKIYPSGAQPGNIIDTSPEKRQYPCYVDRTEGTAKSSFLSQQLHVLLNVGETITRQNLSAHGFAPIYQGTRPQCSTVFVLQSGGEYIFGYQFPKRPPTAAAHRYERHIFYRQLVLMDSDPISLYLKDPAVLCLTLLRSYLHYLVLYSPFLHFTC